MADLDIIYDYYKHVKQIIFDNSLNKQDENGNLNNIYNIMFGYIIDFYQKNGFPQILSDDVYDKIESQEVYRGFKDNEHIGNMLCHYNYHYGNGIIQGMYFTSFKEEALAYTRTGSNISADENKVLKAKILSDNYLNYTDLFILKSNSVDKIYKSCNPLFIQKKKDLIEFCESRKEEHGDDINEFYSIMSRPGVFAVYLGLDYLYRETAKHFIVLNRNIVAIKESEFKKMCEMTTHYKDGSFDFYNLSHENNEK